MKFSIGIPAFKATFLKECLDSILCQTFTDYEVIIVNDDSPEDLDSIIDNFKSEKIRYYKNKQNVGAANVVDNWNICLSYAVGEYFILMGDDDKMLPTYLEEFGRLIEKYPKCDIYHCRTIIIDEQSKPMALTETRPEFETVYDSVFERMKGNRIFFISDYVFRTSQLRNNGGFYKLPLAWASDDISSYIAAMENGIAHTNNPVFMYRANSQTISSTGNIHLKMDAILGEESWLQKFIEADAVSFTDNIIKENITSELRLFIQKKKLRTIYSSGDNPVRMFLKWHKSKQKYRLSTAEILYASALSIKEKVKYKYANRQD